MSTFLGLVEEIPGISIDRFDGENLSSSAFFLSHCHTDHMEGLDQKFFNHLRKRNVYFYCSHISKLFLENRYQLDANFCNQYLIELPLDESRIISYLHNGVEITVTLSCISSGHCPGAVMFLFNINDKRILYTGDFRINKEDFSKLKSLHYGDQTQYIPLKIDKIYLDTTFLNSDFKIFPSRADSSRELCTAIKDWIEKDPKNVVILEISALIGSEFIYMELFKILNKKIHVKNHIYKIYSRMEVFANCVTDVGENTSIHACMNKPVSNKSVTTGLICRPDVDPKNILTIIPSVMKWAKKDTSCIIEWDTKKKLTKNVCYSTHASFTELEAFIQYFKPKEVFPCVCDHKNQQTTYDFLREIMLKTEQDKHDKHVKHVLESNKLSFSKHKIFKSCDIQFKSKLISDDEDDEDDI